MTIKEQILTNTPSYFVYEDLAAAIPNVSKSSLMGRVHELITEGSLRRVRKASNKGRTVAIYQNTTVQ